MFQRARESWSSVRRVRLLLCLLPPALLFAKAEPKKPLAIVHAALLEAEDGFIRPDNVYQPGETIYFVFNIQGYAVDRDTNRVKLSYRIDALDYNGVPFVEPDAGKIDTELAPQDSKWMPRVRFSPTLPLWAESGNYKFAIHVTDELARKDLAQDVAFQVRGRKVEPSASLVARNFQYSRQEDGDPLPAPAYRRGDVLWASFDITGFKIGEKNLVDVDYDLAVQNAENKVIFQQPQPAAERGTSFYPRRYVHATFNLNLEPSIQPGQYIIILTLHDKLGSQADQSRHAFTVE